VEENQTIEYKIGEFSVVSVALMRRRDDFGVLLRSPIDQTQYAFSFVAHATADHNELSKCMEALFSDETGMHLRQEKTPHGWITEWNFRKAQTSDQSFGPIDKMMDKPRWSTEWVGAMGEAIASALHAAQLAPKNTRFASKKFRGHEYEGMTRLASQLAHEHGARVKGQKIAAAMEEAQTEIGMSEKNATNSARKSPRML